MSMLSDLFPPEWVPARQPRTVLDVGCGIQPQDLFRKATTVHLDAHGPYLAKVKGIRVQMEALKFMRAVPDSSFEAVVALDFIEHLPRRQGIKFLREAQRLAPMVVIFTPNGWMEQTGDNWNMGGELWQTHRSGWTVEDFPPPWQTKIVNRPHLNNGLGAFWAMCR